MSTALILIADGTEEMELVYIRGGITCTSALVKTPSQSETDILPLAVCSRGVRIVADTFFDNLKTTEEFDLIVVPGGAKGAETMANDERVLQMLKYQYNLGKLVGMICAGSLAAKQAQIGYGGRITSHPSVREGLLQG
ncbi:hypothetical protein Clacol_004747 [Clathrus columnatus]|uniref:D-lactate dehydratase n=1 Tax=Clathrus columnatus TaxID=1419009 RepID=A0AAV5ADF3_9AGAM|nr:hypothetical protein Clacol_004747 [Clathrus columnatus]